jgi:hypothetical protein
MALLDFINNRKASQEQAAASAKQAQRPETAKEMYTRQEAQERGAERSMGQLPPEQQAKVEAIKARLEKATQHIDKNAPTQSATPYDAAGNREALRQNMTGQDKAAPALSPTTAEAGKTAIENTPTPSKESPSKTPENTPSRAPQTTPRPRPSWER